MGAFGSSRASLRIFGDDLVPNEVSKLLACTPTGSYIKGQPNKPAASHFRRTGAWLLNSETVQPEDLESQLNHLLDQINPDLNV